MVLTFEYVNLQQLATEMGRMAGNSDLGAK